MKQINSAPSNLRLVLVAIGTFLLMCASSIISNSTSYFIVAVTEAIDVTRVQFSVYYTIVSICAAIMSVVCGFVAPKIGFRRSFLIGSIGVAIGFIIMSRLTALWMVYVGAVFIGSFQAFIIVPPVAVVNNWFPKKHNGLVMGLTMAGTGGGGIVMAQVMPRVVEYVDWRTGYLICAIGFAVITLIGNALCGGKAPEYEEEEKTEARKLDKKDASYIKNILSLPFILFVAACVLKNLASVFNQHFSAHLQESFTVGQVATVMTVFNVALLVMKISQGALYDKLKYKVMLILVALSSVAYIGWTSKNYYIVIFCTIILMFCCSTETVCHPLFLKEMYGKEFSSAAWGICRGFASVGNAIGAVLWGGIYDNFGTYNVGLYFEPVAITGICILIFICITLTKRKAKLQPVISE